MQLGVTKAIVMALCKNRLKQKEIEKYSDL